VVEVSGTAYNTQLRSYSYCCQRTFKLFLYLDFNEGATEWVAKLNEINFLSFFQAVLKVLQPFNPCLTYCYMNCWHGVLLFAGPSGIQPVVKAAPITVHDSDSEDEEENMGPSRACVSNSIAQNYSDGEEKSRDPVETREPAGVEQMGSWALLSKIYS